ncbi:MAG: universal stress protein [Euryarchaeota archaeon]|jgi:nucleotide-binding universal stress UspA family protein|nr:universal stress protein [Euryarchaeota archaeon]
MAVLVAYDGLEHTKKALDYAIEYALVFGKKLYILTDIPSKDKLDMDEEMARIGEAQKEAEALARERGVDVQAVVCSGTPQKGILDAAERFSADVIVVGRSDKTFLDRAILGSTSEAVIRNANCTVIVVQ